MGKLKLFNLMKEGNARRKQTMNGLYYSENSSVSKKKLSQASFAY